MLSQPLLNHLTPADAPDLAQWMRDWRRMIYMDPSSRDERDPVTWRAFASENPDFYLVKGFNGQNVGFISFYARENDPHALEIAYYRRPLTAAERAQLPRSFMADAIRAACEQMFEFYPAVLRIYASVIEANVRSAQVAEAAGFRRLAQTGTFLLYAFLEKPDTPRRRRAVYRPQQLRTRSFQPAENHPVWPALRRARRVSYPDTLFVLERSEI